jgi:hypothetical protein
MPIQTWEAVLNAPGTGAGTQLSGSTSLTDISPAPQLVIPANYLYVGQRLRVKAYGILTTAASSQGTLTLGVYWGGVAGTALAVTAANTAPASASSWPWKLNLEIYVRAVGSSGSVWCNGEADIASSLTAYTGYALPSSQTQPISVTTSSANALTVGAQFSSSTTNTITCEDCYIEAIS